MTEQQNQQVAEIMECLGVSTGDVVAARTRLTNLVLDNEELTAMHPIIVASAAIEVAAMLNAVLVATASVKAGEHGDVVNHDILFTSITNAFADALNKSFSISLDRMKGEQK